MRDGPVTGELRLEDTNGILRQPWVQPERTSAGLGWDRQYLSVQRERPYRESFKAAGTHLVILHLDGPVTVRRGEGRLSRSRQVPAGGLFIHPAGRDLTVELGGALSTVHLYLTDDVLQDAAGLDRPVELVGELGTSDRLLEQLVLSMDETHFAAGSLPPARTSTNWAAWSPRSWCEVTGQASPGLCPWWSGLPMGWGIASSWRCGL